MTRLSRIPQASVAIIILIVASLLSRVNVDIGGLTARPEHILGPAIFAVVVGLRFAVFRRPLWLNRYVVLTLGWLALNFASSILRAPSPAESLVHCVRLSILVIIFLTVAHLPTSKGERWVQLFRIWVILGLVELAYGIVTWLVAISTNRFLFGVQVEPELSAFSIAGTLLERNLYGSLAATLLIALLYILWRQYRLRRQIIFRLDFLLLAIMLSLFALFISFTRAGWIAAGIGGGIAFILAGQYFIERVNRAAALLMFAVPAGAIALFLLILLLPDSNLAIRLSSFTDLDNDFTWSTRLQDASNAITDWQASPIIGNGTGSFAQIHGIRAGTEAWISNMILHTMVDVGTIGLLFQLALIYYLFRDTIHATRRAQSESFRVTLASLALGLIVILVSYQITSGVWLALFWVHIGLMVNGIFSERLGAGNANG